MGFRFRRLFRTGPFHLTLSKSGIGWSVGFPGVRYGIGGNGRRYISIGIPGTGLYWFKYLPRFRRSSPPLPPPAPAPPGSTLPQPQPQQTLPPPAPTSSSAPARTQRPRWMQRP